MHTLSYYRRYLPVLKDMPSRYLFEPWKAPKAVQEKANCVVGVDYPFPIVEHNKASKECYNLMMEVKNKLTQQGKGIFILSVLLNLLNRLALNCDEHSTCSSF